MEIDMKALLRSNKERESQVDQFLHERYGVQTKKPEAQTEAGAVSSAGQIAQTAAKAANATVLPLMISQVGSIAAQRASQPKPTAWQTRPYWQPWEENEYNGLTDAETRLEAARSREQGAQSLAKSFDDYKSGKITAEQYMNSGKKADRSGGDGKLLQTSEEIQKEVDLLIQARNQARYGGLSIEELSSQIDQANARIKSLSAPTNTLVNSGAPNLYTVQRSKENAESKNAGEIEQEKEKIRVMGQYLDRKLIEADPDSVPEPLKQKKKQLDEDYKAALELEEQQKAHDKEWANKSGIERFGDWLGTNAYNGLTSFNSQLFSTLGTVLGWFNLNPEGSLVDNIVDYYDSIDRAEKVKQSMINTSMGPGWDVAGELLSSTVNALPQSILALMSGGTSLTGSAMTTGTSTTSQLIGASLKNAAKSPSFWLTTAQTLGPEYQEAIQNGATEEQATVAAFISTALNALVEVGGGLEGLPTTNKGIVDWLKSASEEGVEEVVQDLISQTNAMSIYDQDKELFSTTNENALINPARLAESYMGGAIVGSVLGGGQIALDKAVTKLRTVALPDGKTVQADGNNQPVSVPESSDGAGNLIMPVRVGQNTVIQSPYGGETPVNLTDRSNDIKPVITTESLQQAGQAVHAANTQHETGFKRYLKDFYQKMIGDRFNGVKVRVNGVTFQSAPYDVTLHRNVIGKVLSDPNFSVEKIAVLNQLEDVIHNAEYVGSGNFDKTGKRTNNVERYDYFETVVSFPSENGLIDYVVSFDTEIYPYENKFRTYKIKNIDLTPLSEVLAGTAPVASRNSAGLSSPIIPQSSGKSNGAGIFSPPGLELGRKQETSARPFAQTEEKNGVVNWREAEKGSITTPVNAFEEKWRIKTRVAKPDAETGAAAFLQDGTVVLNAEKVDTFAGAVAKLAHEATHVIEGSQSWDELKKVAGAYYRAVDPELKPGVLREAIRERYKGITELNDVQATQEVVAGFMEDVCSQNEYTAERAVRILLEKSPRGFRRVLEYFREKVDYLKARKGLSKQEKLEFSAARRGLNNLEKALREYRKGQDEARQGTQFSINPEFKNQYDRWDKKSPLLHFKVGTTSNALKSIGINDQDIIFDSSKIIKIKSKHPEMTDSVIKQIPEILENPIVIMASKTKEGRVTIFGEVIDTAGNPVLAVLELHPMKGAVSLNEIKVASAYGKNNAQSFIDSSTILYVDHNEKRTAEWSRFTGLQLPVNQNQSGSFTPTIPQKGRGVNTSISENRGNDTSRRAGRVQYSAGKPFSQAVEEIATHKQGTAYETSHVYMGQTPKILTDLGLDQLPMLITSKHIDTIMNESGPDSKANYHGLGKELVKQIPKALEDPIMVMFSKTKPDQSIVVLTTLMDSKGNPVISAVRFNGYGNYNDIEVSSNVVTSAYGKSGISNFIRKAADENRVLYFDKQKSQQLKQTPGIQFPDNLSTADFSSNIARLQEFVKRAGTNTSISKRDGNDTVYSSGESSFTDYYLEYKARKYGAIPKGENAYREVSIPRQTSEGTKTRRAVRTILEAENTPESAVKALKEEIANEAYAYIPVGDRAAQANAERIIQTRGWEGALKRWEAVANGTEAVSKEALTLGETLMMEAGKRGDVQLFQKLAAEIAAEATRAGQTVQAVRLIKRMTPEGQLYYLQKTVDNLQKKLDKRMKSKAPSLEIDPELGKKLLEAKTTEELEAASGEILASVAKLIPATWQDKWDAWRYMAMLANPRTHIRNVLGNTVFIPARAMKNAATMAIEHLLVKPEGRTQAVLTKADKPLREFAEQNFEEVKDILTGGGKLNPSSQINELRPIFKTKWLESVRKANNSALEGEDLFFLKRAYIDSLTKAAKARKLNLDFLQSGTKEAAVQLRSLEKAAAKEAQEATYRDASKVASALNRLKETNTATDIFGNALLPFTKTPVNVLKRGIEYSPAGLIKGVIDMTYGIKSGKKTASEAVGSLCKGLSGVGITLFGYFLSSMGLLVAGGPDDRKEKGFETLQGAKSYSLKIGDVYYTLDWMAPVALPLFVGAELQKSVEGEGFSVANIADSMTKISEPMFNLSMLDGINSAFKAVSYSDGNYLTDFAVEAAVSYLTQGLPTLGGQIARTVDPTARNSYYVDKNSPIPEAVQEFLNAAQSKIPGLSYLLAPKIDQWGRTSGRDNVLIRAFENFISPGYISTRNETPVDKELAEIYRETGESAVLPSTAGKSFEVDGETDRLSAIEYSEYAKERGQRSYQYINELLSNPDYQKLDADEKAEIVKAMYQAASAEAKQVVNPDYDLPSTVLKAYEANQQAGILYGEYYLWKLSLDGSLKQQDVIDALNRTHLSKAQKRFLFEQRFPEAKQNPF